MGKMRNYTYGSPKFEGEINKAISEAGGDVKLYNHNVFIYATSEDESPYYYGINVYSTDNTPLFTIDNPPTIADVTAFITPYLNAMTHFAPSYISDAVEYSLIVENNVLKGFALAYADLQAKEKAITAIVGAVDNVTEV